MEVVWRECTTSWVLLFPMFQVKMTHLASFFWWCLTTKKSERFEPRSHFTSRLSLIVRVKVFLNRTVFVEKGGSPKYFIYVWGIYKNANSHSQNQVRVYIHENQGPRFQRNYIIAGEKKLFTCHVISIIAESKSYAPHPTIAFCSLRFLFFFSTTKSCSLVPK